MLESSGPLAPFLVGSRVTARGPLADFTWRGLPTPGKNPCLAFGLLAYSLFDIPLFSMLPCNEHYITFQYVHTQKQQDNFHFALGQRGGP
jgi:hypothetical protein